MAKKTYPHELIGQEIEIVDSKNKSNLHLEGKIVNETKNTIEIDHQGTIKTLLKSNITFKIKGTNTLIEGENIIKRPEERIKG
ncbi:hypothetical protein GOV03_00305 [Candidatus Woesearchaeota archaeon]|nr:hypothetical protein [Candidatus Woesearchaeota archaeon]